MDKKGWIGMGMVVAAFLVPMIVSIVVGSYVAVTIIGLMACACILMVGAFLILDSVFLKEIK